MAAPSVAKTKPSTTNCLSRRPLRAPIAVRTASSRARDAARTMIRFDTFAVAIATSRPIDSRNNATTTQNPCPPVISRIGTSLIVQPPLLCGCSAASAAPIDAISAAACSNGTPSFSLAMNRRFRASRGSSAESASGNHTSASAILPNSISGVMTPTTV